MSERSPEDMEPSCEPRLERCLTHSIIAVIPTIVIKKLRFTREFHVFPGPRHLSVI